MNFTNDIEVSRTFCDLSQDEIVDIEQISILTRMGWSGAFGWDKLLESKRILIMSEAGAGKTYECRCQQRKLWDQGEPSFYLELAELARNNLRDLLSPSEDERFDEWLAAQSDVATFFLDSIDELKLSLGSFEAALKRLNRAIAGQLGRVRIITTTRPIPIDQKLIQQYLPVPEPVQSIASGDAFADIVMGRQQKREGLEEDSCPIWRNVALMPLSDAQIREMATIQGIDDADLLLTDIHARNAEDFARRPQDLIELCADWREHRRIRTHREQVVNNVRIKLKPRTDRREPAQLTPEKAIEGASRLALAALLSRRLTIRFSVDADLGGEAGSALDPQSVLYDWTYEECETLLERSLFGFASYGRVRFHHRSVLEFLVAEYLDNRLSHGMPIKAVKRLLFAETPQGIKVVRPTMRPVAAWLAQLRPSIFSEVRDRAPELLFDYADPESLSTIQRLDVLTVYARRYGKGGKRGLHVPRVQVHRFASPELSEQVLNLWQEGVENVEIRELMLELIGAGQMTLCADVAYKVATDEVALQSERLEAIAALIRLNDVRVEGIAQSMIDTPTLWPDPIVRSAIVQLFPQHISPEQLCRILQRISRSAKTIDEIEWLVPQEITGLEFPDGYLEELREGVTSLVVEGVVWQKQWPHYVSDRSHLLPLLASICLRLLGEGKADTEVLRSSAIVLRLERVDHVRDEPAKKLRDVISRLASTLREAIFWSDDSFRQTLHPEADPQQRLLDAIFDGPLDLNGNQDSGWVEAYLGNPEHPLPERTMICHASMREAWDGDGDWHNHLVHLQKLVSDEPNLLALIEKYLAPREADPETVQLQKRIERQRKAAEKRKATDHSEWVAVWREIAEYPDYAFCPEREGNTAWNLWLAMQSSERESRESGWNRRFIEQHFGKEVADKLREIMRTIWRGDHPTLRHERSVEERNTILVRWQFGLAAITAEAEDPNWAGKLSASEAELAARYAPIEVNGFPSWLKSLACEHPVSVEQILGPALSAELGEIVVSSGSFGILLQDISNAPSEVVRLFLPRLRGWLDVHGHELRDGEDEAVACRRLDRVLKILLEHGDDEVRAHIRSMAEEQLEQPDEAPFSLLWLTILMRLDPVVGIEILERHLARLDVSADGPAVDIFGTVFGDRNSNLHVDLKCPGFTPSILLRLARLAYCYVRPSDDITHEGTYHPGPRDDAQDGRSAILNAVINCRGTEGWAVKLQMLEDPLFAHFRERLAMLAREKAAEECDDAVLNEEEIADLNRYGEAPPVTRDEMLTLLVDRLDDLDDLLLQDVSPRAAWESIRDEKVLRQLISLQLRSMSNHLYTVDQEAVTADEKETDIRLRATSGQQATIELKVGENWSGSVLRDTIKKQLVTKYMAAESCRSGCLLVTVASDRNWMHPESREKIDIQGLRTMLEIEGKKIMDQMGGELRIAIKVLDLRPRLEVESRT